MIYPYEEWREIPGFEEIYEASNLGRIRSVEGKTTVDKRGVIRTWNQRVLKPKVTKRKGGKEDKRVSLWKNGVESTWLVSRLVAMAFLDVPYSKLTVNHINGNPMDNRIENLEWVTLAENIKHGFDTGQYNSSKKPVILTNKFGEKFKFDSMADADRYLRKCRGYVWGVMAYGRKCYDINGREYSVVLVESGDSSS